MKERYWKENDMSTMKHSWRNSQDKLRKEYSKTVPWSSYERAAQERWNKTVRFLPMTDYTSVLEFGWKAHLPANKVVAVIAYVESTWDHEDSECPTIAYEYVKDNLAGLKEKKRWLSLVGRGA